MSRCLSLVFAAAAFAVAAPGPASAGPEWAAYEHSVEIAPGGVFDASRFADAPAGTVIAEDTQLVYEIVER